MFDVRTEARARVSPSLLRLSKAAAEAASHLPVLPASHSLSPTLLSCASRRSCFAIADPA